jgi:hypothetical protein
MKGIVIAALLGVAIMALTGCGNMLHDMHEKSGGAAKAGPGGGVPTISLSGTDFPTTVEYGYSPTEAGSITVTITNTGDGPTGPLFITLEGSHAVYFTLSATSVDSIAPRQTGTFKVSPALDLLPGQYTAGVRVSGEDVPGGNLPKNFTVKVNGHIDLTQGTSSQAAISSGAWTYSAGEFILTGGKAVEISGTGVDAAYHLTVAADPSGKTTNIRLNNAHITGISGASALKLAAGAKVALELGEETVNKLNAGSGGHGGIEAADGTELLITGTGKLEAKAASQYYAGIGGGPEADGGIITIEGGTIEARGGTWSAGIGGGGSSGGGIGGAGGKITISGGMVTTGRIGGGSSGGGNGGAGGEITISGGMVTTDGGIGGGNGNGAGGTGGVITISGGTVTARNTVGAGAGIGGGSGSGSNGAGGTGGVITISGGTVTAWSAVGTGAGIGGGGGGEAGDGGAGGEITISGGTVTARSIIGAGIGGGGNSNFGGGGTGGVITISGGIVTARGAGAGAGIGGGYGTNGGGGAGGTIIISDGTVYASSTNGSGIGPGQDGPASGTFSTNGGTPVIFASSIKNLDAYVNTPDSGIIAGTGVVTVTMGLGDIIIAGAIFERAITSVTVTLNSPFTVPSGATLTIPGDTPPPPLPSVPVFTLNLNDRALTNYGTIVVQRGGILTGTPGGTGTVIRE